ncbi:hypothetical protein M885DRAFT_507102 [Pelagophyceae sp. CCMP2097]|nr:hypothetical protein M885DRAFT_507102 [Pelagophyceae sp. CCMP2097]
MAATVPDLLPNPADEFRLARPKKARLTLRIWRFPVGLHVHHAYIAGTGDLGGLSERLQTIIPFDPDRTTLERLRIPIEVENHQGMNRRTSLFQELLAVMLQCDNPHSWPSATALTFRFGVWPDNNYSNPAPETTPNVIPFADEEDLVSKWITNPLEQDLILIPQTQIGVGDVCTLVCVAEPR